ncbi:MAG: hypothetical protein KIT20_15145 [Alphaproteobacteria bacterium]|nr:hypothetical protein [Alphaproteobacteria bacterium]
MLRAQAMKTNLMGKVRLPRSRLGRLGLGWALVLGGILGFLPVLGFWMLPLGLAILSVDSPWIRRRRRRVTVWWLRKWRARAEAKAARRRARGA